MTSKQIYSKYRTLLYASKRTLHEKDVPLVRKSLDLLIKHCSGQTSLSGDSIIIHAMNVAHVVVAEMSLGISAISAALLQYTYPSLKTEKTDIVKTFGQSTLNILEGLVKIASIESSQASYQSESFRKLLLSLADDVRVILIKLAGRLVIMRNLDGAAEKDRLAIASETYFLYAPLAHRLGLYNLKSEFEDLAIKYLEPEQYNYIYGLLKKTASSRNRLIKEFTVPVKEKLLKQGFTFTIKSRTKSIHSILSKMRKQGVDFDEVFDIFAVRVIIKSEPENEKSDCWQAYSVITDLYQPNPSRLRDWISVPKSNGYESLHTTVIGPRGKWVEVQIRSERMDEIAEKGLAAHFRYKGLREGESGLDQWLAKIREILESSDRDESFIDHIRPGLYSDEVFVFTPKGELRQLPAGATVLDFAFDIHTEVGRTCVGAKVNGKNVTLKYILQNGDHVSVLTSRNQKPGHDWLSFVVTTKAKSKIRQALNEEKTLKALEGKEILTRRLKNWKISYSDQVINKLQMHYQLKTAQDLYYLIALEKINLLEIKDILTRPEVKEKEEKSISELKTETLPEEFPGATFTDYLVIDEKVEGLDYKLAKCCNPVFGDRIFGFVTVSEGIKIHRTSCPNAQYMLARFPYRYVAARWTKSKDIPNFRASVKITGVAEVGIVNKIADIISESKVTLRSFNYNMIEGMFEGTLQIMVPNNDVLQSIIKKIHLTKGIIKVVRTDSSDQGAFA